MENHQNPNCYAGIDTRLRREKNNKLRGRKLLIVTAFNEYINYGFLSGCLKAIDESILKKICTLCEENDIQITDTDMFDEYIVKMYCTLENDKTKFNTI